MLVTSDKAKTKGREDGKNQVVEVALFQRVTKKSITEKVPFE